MYITFEEFKGRAPIVRHGQEFLVQANDFDNPFLSVYYYSRTGGTTGTGTRAPIDLDHIAARIANRVVAHAAHDIYNVPTIIWRGALPDSTGFNNLLQGAHVGAIPQRWYTPLTDRDVKPALKHRLATGYLILMGRIFGSPFPWPEPLPLDQAGVIARWAVHAVKTHGRCLIRAGISLAVRIALAAKDEGLDLTGAVFMGASEPVTPAKVKAITDVGARHITNYAFVETGQIGVGCATPLDVNQVHFMKDYLALIQMPRKVPGADLTVDAFCYTALLTTAPKILLNAKAMIMEFWRRGRAAACWAS